MKDREPAQTELMFTAWKKDSTPNRMRELLGVMASDIDGAIRRSGNEINPLNRGIAKRVVIHAAQSYNPTSGAQFGSWANTQLRRLTRELRQRRFATKVPETSAREAFRVHSMIAQIEADEGVLPTEAVLADRLKSHREGVRNTGAVHRKVNLELVILKMRTDVFCQT